MKDEKQNQKLVHPEEGIIFSICAKCGKKKVASRNRNITKDESIPLEMVIMGYGKYRGAFVCKNCKQESNYIEAKVF